MASQSAQDQADLQRLQSYFPDNVAHNARQFYYIRSTSLSVAGSVAGVLGLTNLSGLYLYALALLLTNVSILILAAHGTPGKYTVQPSASVEPSPSPSGAQRRRAALHAVQTLAEGAQENGFSFVLWWTFWFGIVHVYD